MAWGVRALTPIKVDRSLSKPLVKPRAPSISPKLSMKGPSNYILLGRLQEALKLKGTIRKAADEVHMPYTTARRWLKGLAQPQISKQRRVGSLDASSDMAAYDLLGNNTAAQAALRLFEDGRAPRVLSKTTIIRAARRLNMYLKSHLAHTRDHNNHHQPMPCWLWGIIYMLVSAEYGEKRHMSSRVFHILEASSEL